MRIGGTSGQLPSEPVPPAHLHQRAETEAIVRAGLDRLSGAAPAGGTNPPGMPIDQAIDAVVRRGWAPPRPPSSPKGGAR
ncbi:hypothetical protein D3C72_2073350 [compost metagenome]